MLAYAGGILSSRRITAACQENIVFMALSADAKPHFTTIAKFIASMADVIQPLFTDVLLYCDQLGLIQGEMFAVDGCKLPSNAGKQHSGTREELRQRRNKLATRAQRLLDVHARNDAAPSDHDDPTHQRSRDSVPARTQTKQIGIRLQTRPGTVNPGVAQMRDKIDRAEGRRIYNQRLGAVEPVFGNHRNHGRDRFTLRGRSKVNAQWQLYNLVHNVGKLHTSGRMAA